MEREHGSVLRGAFRAGRQRVGAGRASPTLWSFREGMAELTDRLAAPLGGRVRLRAAVTRLRREGAGWAVEAGGTAAVHDAVVLAAPAYALARIRLEAAQGDRLAELVAIPHPPVATIVLGFRRADVGHPLDGFGVLVPAVEGRPILGVVFSSTLFPGRAPPDHVTLSAFVGGARQPDVATLDADELQQLALRELGELLGVREEPVFRAYARWPQAIPQYLVGYGRFLAVLEAVESANPALRFAGSYRHGVALGDALRSGLEAAAAIHTRVPPPS